MYFWTLVCGALTRAPPVPNFCLPPDCTYSGAQPGRMLGGSLAEVVQSQSKILNKLPQNIHCCIRFSAGQQELMNLRDVYNKVEIRLQ